MVDALAQIFDATDQFLHVGNDALDWVDDVAGQGWAAMPAVYEYGCEMAREGAEVSADLWDQWVNYSDIGYWEQREAAEAEAA